MKIECRLLAPICAMLFALPSFAQDLVPTRPPEITAVGRGQARVAPSLAAVFIVVTTRAATASQAASDNSARSESTIRALRSSGLSQDDITTAGFSVSQNYELPIATPGAPLPGQRQPSGFIARNTLRVEVKRIADVGKVIDAALAAGATEVGNVQFLPPNDPNTQREAVAMAVREARVNAEAIARSAGGTLGRLLSLSSAGAPISPTGFYDFSDTQFRVAGGQASMMPRDVTVTAQVVGRWEFLPGTR